MPVTFGFEAEVATPGAGLAAELHRRQLMNADCIHSYHCDCNLCMFTPPDERGYIDHEECEYDWRPFRMQRDSSCGGEVISDILTLDDLPILRELQDAMVDADAEPGEAAGFHVHVGLPMSLNSAEFRGRIALCFAAIEPLFLPLAQSAAPFVRGFNRSLRSDLARYFLDMVGSYNAYHYFEKVAMAECEHNPRAAYVRLLDQDRHQTLSVHPEETVEFRIWNSTRSAWRMELAIRLSIALTMPEFIDSVFDSGQVIEVYTTENMDWLLGLLSTYDSTAAELAARQVEFTRLGKPTLAYS